MSSNPYCKAWAGPWVNGSDGESHTFRTDADAFNISSFMSMYPENDPFHLDLNELSAQPSHETRYTVCSTSRSSVADTWTDNVTPLDFATAAPSGLQAIGNEDHFAFNPLPMSPNTVSSIPQSSMAVAVPRTRSRRPDSRLRGSNANVRRDDTIKCEWKGCTYTGLFARKAELKRHVETQHISPSSHECPEPTCMRTFNRRDNLDEHLRRTHFQRH